MMEAFREFLDGMFWEGYAEEFENDNPQAFYSQYREFRINHSLPL